MLPDSITEWVNGDAWAANGDRKKPDDSTLSPSLVRGTGWPSSFSSTEHLRREVVNGIFYELYTAAGELVRRGILPWDTAVNYKSGATVQSSGDIYKASVDTGPATSNATDPQTAGQTVWTRQARVVSAPAAPNAPTGTGGNGQVEWEWNCPLDNGAAVSGFTIQWREQGGSFGSTNQATVTRPRHVVTGLDNGTTYEARVKATNTSGDSGWSSTGSAAAAAEAPGQVLGFTGTAGDSEVDLNWAVPDDGGSDITRYEVQWKSGAEAFASSRQQNVTDGSSTTVTGLTNGTAETFRVRAVNAAGNGTWSGEITVTPASQTAEPDAPNAPTGSENGASITWTWGAPADNGAEITGYSLRYRKQGTSAWTTVTTASTSYVTSGLERGVTYEAQVAATNSIGTSDYSSSGTEDTVLSVPGIPFGLSLSSRDEALLLSWDAPDNGGAAITGYTIQWREDGQSYASARQTTAAATDTEETISNLTNDTEYYVRIRAQNSEGSGAWSSSDGLTGTPMSAEQTFSTAGSHSFNWPYSTDRARLVICGGGGGGGGGGGSHGSITGGAGGSGEAADDGGRGGDGGGSPDDGNDGVNNPNSGGSAGSDAIYDLGGDSETIFAGGGGGGGGGGSNGGNGGNGADANPNIWASGAGGGYSGGGGGEQGNSGGESSVTVGSSTYSAAGGGGGGGGGGAGGGSGNNWAAVSGQNGTGGASSGNGGAGGSGGSWGQGGSGGTGGNGIAGLLETQNISGLTLNQQINITVGAGGSGGDGGSSGSAGQDGTDGADGSPGMVVITPLY